MNQFEMLWFGVWGSLWLISLTYWGVLAWLYPDKLKEKLMKRAEKYPDWFFMKGYSSNFSDKYGILMMRFITLAGALMTLAIGILILLG
jgi:hypothetical protein